MERFEGKELKFKYYMNPEMGFLFKEVEEKYQQLKTMNVEVSLKFDKGKQFSHIKWSRILKNLNATQEQKTEEQPKTSEEEIVILRVAGNQYKNLFL